MLLFVGLGNPGPKYEGNRHNIGFMAVNEIARRHSFGPWRARFQGLASEGVIAGEKVMALKPMTFMNESGRSVGEAVRFFKLPVDAVSVFYDELDLVPGKMRLKRGGGSGGHNGIRDIDRHIDTNYRRVRLGIGHPGDKNKVHSYVLSDFAKVERSAWLETLIDAVAREVGELVRGDEARFMSLVAHAVFPPPPKPAKPAPDKTTDTPKDSPASDGA
ncbi:aminoacyl-tRNA hydrolase [Thalassobaculum salexigens]|uniref:aminoacyl-tRNA hydrolase n=1 Tax=Thalassobaculum salexigens TaxID=455360 RepID=UPI0004106838|nr:aminoacyl-tRNA hydrolase [Thalassobaculum salexigens]